MLCYSDLGVGIRLGYLLDTQVQFFPRFSCIGLWSIISSYSCWIRALQKKMKSQSNRFNGLSNHTSLHSCDDFGIFDLFEMISEQLDLCDGMIVFKQENLIVLDPKLNTIDLSSSLEDGIQQVWCSNSNMCNIVQVIILSKQKQKYVVFLQLELNESEQSNLAFVPTFPVMMMFST